MTLIIWLLLGFKLLVLFSNVVAVVEAVEYKSLPSDLLIELIVGAL